MGKCPTCRHYGRRGCRIADAVIAREIEELMAGGEPGTYGVVRDCPLHEEGDPVKGVLLGLALGVALWGVILTVVWLVM